MATIVPFRVDDAEYRGDERDGVYYQVAEGPSGWYFTAVVDSDTGGFVDTIVKDDGPYSSEREAQSAGESWAIEWCLTNEVKWVDEEMA